MSNQFIDATIKTPCTIGIYGSRATGKSYFTKQLLLHQEIFVYPIFEKVIWIYKHYQTTIFDDLKQKFQDKLVLMDEFPDFTSLPKQKNTVFIIDDFLTETVNSDEIKELYINGRHLNISVICLSQNMFIKGKHTITMNRNTDYLVIFENIRDQTIIRTLSYQMYPGNTKFLISAYNDAIKQSFGHLFVDTKPNSNPLARVRGNIFNFFDKLIVYVPKYYKTNNLTQSI